MSRTAPHHIHDPKTPGERASDAVTKAVGSWRFIGFMSLLLTFWIIWNSYIAPNYFPSFQFDPIPLILLNLILSFQAAYTAPAILMSANRQSEKDRLEAEQDYEIDKQAERDIAEVKENLMRLEKMLTELALYLSH